MNDLIRNNFSFPFINNSVFDEMINDFFEKPSTFLIGKDKNTYPMNVITIKKNGEIVSYRLEYALAGFKKEEIKISISNNILKVEATHNSQKEENEDNDTCETVYYNGISYRNMYASFKLMEDANCKKITSKFENGLLCITIPIKKEVEESKFINID